MRRRRKFNFRRLIVLNTPTNREVSKLVSSIETMLQSTSPIIFDSENNWCIVGIQKTHENHLIIKRMINVMYGSNTICVNKRKLPWLNMIYMSLNTKTTDVESLFLLRKCTMMSSASDEYIERILKNPDPTLYYMRIHYDESIDLLWNTELSDTIIGGFKKHGVIK